MGRGDNRTRTAAEELEEHRGICMEHSGLTTRVNIVIALAAATFAVLGYQAIYQVPSLKFDIAQQLNGLERRIEKLEGESTVARQRTDRLERFHVPEPRVEP